MRAALRSHDGRNVSVCEAYDATHTWLRTYLPLLRYPHPRSSNCPLGVTLDLLPHGGRCFLTGPSEFYLR